MAALLDALPNEAGNPAPPAIQQMAQGDAQKHSHTTEVYKSVMPELVKGAGFAPRGGNAPLTDSADIMTRAAQATTDLRAETWRGFQNKSSVIKGMNPRFLEKYGALKTALEAPSAYDVFSKVIASMPGGADALEKSFTAGNLGVGSVYGLVPFDLLAPSRLIYPVYTLYRNKFPRPPGQGTSRMERVFTGISGSQTGGQSVLDISIPELVQSSGTLSSSSWPLNLPPAGSQTMQNLNIPYRFFGVTEQLSWLN